MSEASNAGAQHRAVLYHHGRQVTLGELLARAHTLALRLPPSAGIVNLCERRDLFITAFCAAIIRNETTYLPASRAPGVVRDVLDAYPGSITINDDGVLSALNPPVRDSFGPDERLDPPADLIAALAFTSGTTGVPQRQLKIWRALLGSNALNAAAIRAILPAEQQSLVPWIVATVPAQHMYGFETSVLLPLIGGMAVHAGRPLFPADVAAALAEVPEPRILVTTPVHLRALLESSQHFPEIAVVVSATAPLEAAVAHAVETQLRTRVLEMFGSTETCVIATRQTARETAWKTYAGVELRPEAEQTVVSAPWFAAPVALQDLLDVHSDGTFVVRGRHADMIEVAGKRASLSELTRRLRALRGVTDAAVFQLDAPEGGGVRRVAALVVARDRCAEELSAEFAEQIDPAFLPRPLVLVESLPRNELGKLPRAKLLAALRSTGLPVELDPLRAVQAVELDQ